MSVGVQYRGTVGPGETQQVFTFNWAASQHVIWYVTPTTPAAGAPQLDWDTQVERASADHITYWIIVRNLTGSAVDFEVRYSILT